MLAQDCARTYRANSVLTASAGQLVLMMFDGALGAMVIAREALARPPEDYKRIEIVNKHLLKAQNILAELQGTLNHEAGGEFAQTMHRLYDYFNRRLSEANRRKQVEPILEVERMLGSVRAAWAEMLMNQAAAADGHRRSVA